MRKHTHERLNGDCDSTCLLLEVVILKLLLTEMCRENYTIFAAGCNFSLFIYLASEFISNKTWELFFICACQITADIGLSRWAPSGWNSFHFFAPSQLVLALIVLNNFGIFQTGQIFFSPKIGGNCKCWVVKVNIFPNQKRTTETRFKQFYEIIWIWLILSSPHL